jgi:DtxR family manganese transport transcriptional regulator
MQEIAEDYTELIANIIEAKGMARVCDVSREMGISHVSVLRTLKRLVRDGYLLKGEETGITLTSKGEEMATLSKKKHTVLTAFLRKLGVPEHIASIDVEGLEHYISHTTLYAIEEHLKVLQQSEESHC